MFRLKGGQGVVNAPTVEGVKIRTAEGRKGPKRSLREIVQTGSDGAIPDYRLPPMGYSSPSSSAALTNWWNRLRQFRQRKTSM
jgi:hypothetical protein